MAIFTKQHKRSGVTWFYIRFEKADGRRKTEKASPFREQAEKLLRIRLGQVAAGTYVDPKDVARAQALTFAAFADRFLREYATGRRSDYYAQALRPADEEKGTPAGPIRRYFGDELLEAIAPKDLDRYRTHCMLEDGVGPSTTRKRLMILGTMFKMAQRWEVRKDNPCRDLEKPKEPSHRIRFLSREEWGRLLDVASPELRPMLRLAVSTGMRLKELTGLRWQDVELDAKLLHVSEDNKTGLPRTIPLSDEAKAVLEEQRTRRKTIGKEVGRLAPYVFTDPEGESFHTRERRNRISKATVAAMKAAKIADASFHTLRHTAAAWMVQRSVDLYQVQHVLGHSSPTMTQRYAHLRPEHLRGAVDALSAAIRDRANQPATRSENDSTGVTADSASATLPSTSENVGR